MTKKFVHPITDPVSNNNIAIGISVLCTILILVRNIWMFWNYSYAFYPDSNLYVHLGYQFFNTWYVSPLVTFPYLVLNAITGSYTQPSTLVWAQIGLASLVGGFLVFIFARKDLLFGFAAGILLLFDLVWGALTKSILTDGVFATLSLLAVGLLIYHYDRRKDVGYGEALLSGFFFALSLSIRPSHIFLIALLPPLYFWLLRSWKKTLMLVLGIGIFFSMMGWINYRSTMHFYILSSQGGYTNDYLVFPLFVYHLYSPENGPASKTISSYLESCYPGEDFLAEVDRSPSGAFDSVTNMTLMNKRVIPCLQSHSIQTNLVSSAYIEAIKSSPVQFATIMLREVGVFLRYGNPYILRWQNNASSNYGCSDMAWCERVGKSRAVWDYRAPIISLYEKVASKVHQVYLAPVGLISVLSPEKTVLPYLTSSILTALFALWITKGRLRFLAVILIVFIAYTAVVVVAGLGFTERYASMLAPLQTILSTIVWISLIRIIFQLGRTIRRLIFRLRFSQATSPQS